MPSYFVTGANRGIGLGIVVQLLAIPGSIVVAGVRNPDGATALHELKTKYQDRLALVQFDLHDPAKIEAAAKATSELLPDGLDYLVNNAGVNKQPVTPWTEIDLGLFEEEVLLNTITPVRILRAFLPLVRQGQKKKVVFISTGCASIENAVYMPELSNAYSVAKAALNMLARKWGATLKSEGITTMVIHPGWVDTELGITIDDFMAIHFPSMGKISVDESTSGCVSVIHGATLEDAPVFYNYDGTRIPW